MLYEVSATGGLVQLDVIVPAGSLAELKMHSKSGPITVLVELLPVRKRPSGKVQPFRFVALDEQDHERLASVLREMIALGYGV